MDFHTRRKIAITFGIAAWIYSLFGQATLATPCTNGADTRQELCKFFFYYAPPDQPLDPRIALRVGANSSDQTRSIALIVGISSYPKIPGASIKAAQVDVDRLKTFFRDDQHFDEVIVLENSDATSENINYFLNVYMPERVVLFNGRSRFLFAYTGHGVPAAGAIPASLLLSQASSISDTGNLYNLALLRTSLETLATSNFHVLAMINACYGGTVFGIGAAGGNPSVSNEPGSYALTAGSSDMPVATFGGPTDGSIFFDAAIKGIKSGEADKDYLTVIDGSGNVIQQGGVVRLGALTNYLTTYIEKLPPLQVAGLKKPLKLKAPWIGPVEAPGLVARGGFFFLNSVAPSGANGISIPTGPISSLPGRPDIKVFGAPEEYPIRGITISYFEGGVDWPEVKKAGITFAYIRVGSSRGKDPTFKHHWHAAGEQGIDRGPYLVYSYCQPIKAQVEMVRSVVPTADSFLPIAIDVESYDFPGNTIPAEAACARAASEEETRNRVLDLAEALNDLYGQTPVIYANRRILARLARDPRFERYMVWLASYSKSGEPASSALKLSGSNPWTLWQYSVRAVVQGIGDRCDSNVFFGTPHQYNAFKAGVGNIAFEAASGREAD
jgi:GH25 family lysozyme M1 (1,4-beta-N-acetylmuramidase)